MQTFDKTPRLGQGKAGMLRRLFERAVKKSVRAEQRAPEGGGGSGAHLRVARARAYLRIKRRVERRALRQVFIEISLALNARGKIPRRSERDEHVALRKLAACRRELRQRRQQKIGAVEKPRRDRRPRRVINGTEKLQLIQGRASASFLSERNAKSQAPRRPASCFLRIWRAPP